MDLVSMWLSSKPNEEIRFSLWLIDFRSKYSWVIPLSENYIDKIWVDKGADFYGKVMKESNIEMCATEKVNQLLQNLLEVTQLLQQWFNKPFMIRICIFELSNIWLLLVNVYIDKLADFRPDCGFTIHNTMKWWQMM